MGWLQYLLSSIIDGMPTASAEDHSSNELVCRALFLMVMQASHCSANPNSPTSSGSFSIGTSEDDDAMTTLVNFESKAPMLFGPRSLFFGGKGFGGFLQLMWYDQSIGSDPNGVEWPVQTKCFGPPPSAPVPIKAESPSPARQLPRYRSYGLICGFNKCLPVFPNNSELFCFASVVLFFFIPWLCRGNTLQPASLSKLCGSHASCCNALLSNSSSSPSLLQGRRAGWAYLRWKNAMGSCCKGVSMSWSSFCQVAKVSVPANINHFAIFNLYWLVFLHRHTRLFGTSLGVSCQSLIISSNQMSDQSIMIIVVDDDLKGLELKDLSDCCNLWLMF